MFCVNQYTVKAKILMDYLYDINSSFSGTVKSGRYPSLSSCWETDTENLFYVGTAMAAIDRQSASGFIHGFRYNIRTLHNILENRSFSAPLPQTTIPDRQLQQIAETVIGESDNSTINVSFHQCYDTDKHVAHTFSIPKCTVGTL